MHHRRPKNLNLWTIRFPLTAIASILHRISGFVLFFLIPGALWVLHFSLTSHGYEMMTMWFNQGWFKLLCWALLVPFCYHLVAGLRHLLSDMHVGNTRHGGKIAAMLVFVFTAILVLLAGVWIW